MKLARPLLLLVAALAVSSCGFNPVGSRPLPDALKSVHVELVDAFRVSAPPVEEALKARIERSGGTLKSTPEDARSVLRLSNLREAQEVLSIGADGRAIEYRLVTQVTFEMRRVIDGRAEILIAPESQTVSREYSFSAQQILAKEAEEARLRRYIQEELAERVLLRLTARLAGGDPSRPEVTPDIVPATGSDAAPQPAG